MTLFDSQGSYDFTIPGKSMLLPGSQVGEANDDKCYIAIFMNGDATINNWFVGTIFM